ncbi:universal stress protein [Streptomyces sp. NPDC057565]|uniref:universal stress protein n=1 Tax=Streptomyces sp. NPDC057565 TaxID=3346169 RepID=UPI0036B885A6
MNHSIVVGLDGSTESTAAVHWAAREALLRDAPLHLVHAADWSSPLGVPATGTAAGREWAEALLRDAVDELRRLHDRLEVRARSVDGRPAVSLATAAASADMLVLGSRGLGTLTGFVLGSVGLRVIPATERPVILVRAHEDALPHTEGLHTDRDIVVGIDIGRPCDALLDFAFEEASRRRCTLHALLTWTFPPLAGYGAAYDVSLQEQMADSMTVGLDDRLQPWRDAFPSVDVVARATVGHAAEQLVETGAEAGLVVVGRRIRQSSVGAHIGPVAHAVLHHSRAPVAVIAHR